MSHGFELLQGMEAERSLDSSLFKTALQEEKLHDVTLKGKDGVTVTASRLILALRSKYFETMFMGSFRESTSTVIDADYPGAILKAVVEYIHTDTTPILEINMEENRGEISESQIMEFRTLICLTEAAAYYNLPKLCYKVHSCMERCVSKVPSLSLALLEGASQDGPVISEDLLETSLANIRSNNVDMLKDEALGSLSYSALHMFLERSKSKLLSQKRFEMIRDWAGTSPGQQASADDLIQDHVELHWIDPDFLSYDVAPTGLVTKDQLLEAFQHQAKRAKHDFKISFHNSIAQPEWSHAKSNVFSSNTYNWKSDWLNIQTLVLGKKYRWAAGVKTLHGGEYVTVWLGVANSATNMDLKASGGDRRSCWGVYAKDCCVYPVYSSADGKLSGLQEVARFRNGSIVTLTLDLTEEDPSNGSLSISVDGGASILAVSNMRAFVEGSNGFLPAASCFNASATIQSIEFL